MHTELGESAALLNNPPAEKNDLIGKFIFGMGALGGTGVTIYQVVRIAAAPETDKWWALGTSIVIVGISFFGLYRAYSTPKTQIADLKSVVVNNSDPELGQISDRIDELAKLIQPEQKPSDFSVQRTIEISVILEKLNFIKNHLASQNANRNQNLHSVISESSESNSSSALIKISEKISGLFSLIPEKKNGQLNITIHCEDSIIGQLNFIETYLKSQKTENLKLSRELKTSHDDLETQTEKASTLELKVQFSTNQLEQVYQSLGSLQEPIMASDVGKIRGQIAQLIITPSHSEMSTASNSVVNSTTTTPTKSGYKWQ